MVEGQNKVDELSESGRPEDRAEAQRLIQNPPPELVEEARRLNMEIEKKGGPKYKSAVMILGFGDRPPDSTYTAGEYMIGWLAWHKYGKTVKQLKRESHSSHRASKQLMSVMSDYDRWRFGKLDPEKMKFKFDRQHFRLMVGGLDLGMENLTPEELADCFDAMCTCGAAHYPENLRKLRSRIIEAVEEIQRSEQPQSSGAS